MAVSGIPEMSVSGTIPEVRLKVDMIRTAWIVAIKRAGKTPTSKWAPSNSAVVCGRHFVASDYASVTYR